MTSCVLSLFFLVSLCSSVNSTGLKVQITDKAHNVVRDVGLEYLKEFLNKPFEEFMLGGRVNCQIKRLTFTSLTVKPENFRLTFMQNSGLKFQIKDLIFTADLKRDINGVLFKEFKIDSRSVTLVGSGVSATIEVRLQRNQQGRLNVEIPQCEFKANIMIESNGKMGAVWDSFKPKLQSKINSEACGFIQTGGVSTINDMLNGLTMETPLYADRNINMDYSLSGDVTVTTSSLDVPFKGMVFFGDNNNVAVTGKDPVIAGNDRMAFVGVSDIFFKSAAQAIFNAGTFPMNPPEIGWIKRAFLSLVGIPTGPVNVDLAEVPTITIGRNGISVQARGTVSSQANPDKVFPLACKVDMNVNIQGNRVILLSTDSKCEVQPQTIAGRVAKPLVKFGVQSKIKDFIKSWFDGGVLIPLPKGVNFNGEVTYHDGFVVAGGDMTFDPSGAQAVVKDMGR